MNPVTRPEFVVDAGAIAVIDGQDGVGHVLTLLATREAVRRAKTHGLGCRRACATRTISARACTTRSPVRARDASRCSRRNGGPAMAPWGGMKKIVGTNPWSIAAPAGKRPPFVVDMAATGVARGKIYLARNKRLPIPLGWAINAAGAPTTDPQEAIDGIILPMAEHKGYAIATMVDMLSGVLTGSGFLSAVHSPYKTAEKSNCGHLMIALDIDRFQPLAEFNARMEQFVAELKAVPLAKGFDEVFYPGEMEANNNLRNRREGIEFPEDTLADLKRIAKETGLEALVLLTA